MLSPQVDVVAGTSNACSGRLACCVYMTVMWRRCEAEVIVLLDTVSINAANYGVPEEQNFQDIRATLPKP